MKLDRLVIFSKTLDSREYIWLDTLLKVGKFLQIHAPRPISIVFIISSKLFKWTHSKTNQQLLAQNNLYLMRESSRMVSMLHHDSSFGLQINTKTTQHRVVVEEIDGLIRVYKDGHVERPPIVPCVGTSLAPELGITCQDMIIDKYTNVWARLYVPNATLDKLPIIVYFHGGGFCVGSTSWICYHEFLAKLSSKANCVIVSVDYRLAPENPLPAAYDDGAKALVWTKQQAFVSSNEWWTKKCDFSHIFLGGDSAGANIAYNVALRLKHLDYIKGLLLIQPFFGGEVRTHSEKYMVLPPRSALTLATSDTYWRLSLPTGATRDHTWCNPVARGVAKLPILTFISEMDILKDRNLEFCASMSRCGHKVEQVVCKGVGHAFHILNKSPLSQARVHELISHINNFMRR